MLKLYFQHTICHNSDTFRCILREEGGGGLWQIVRKNIIFNVSEFVGFIAWVVY